MKNLILFATLFSISTAFAWNLKGTYTFSGSGYQGEAVIAPQGENYSVIWRVGTRQIRTGIGILQGDCFSVAFTDVPDSSSWGVISYQLEPLNKLSGKWTYSDGQTQRLEFLVLKSASIY